MPGQILTTPANCRRHAAECARIAAIPEMTLHREALLIIAAQWRKIADDTEAAARLIEIEQ
ncbi:MAG TPA: hypothetical protein VID77_11270 [Stellaceae bacterium]|jgi:hypothetical protein